MRTFQWIMSTFIVLIAAKAHGAEVNFQLHPQTVKLSHYAAISCQSRIQSLRTGKLPSYDLPPVTFSLSEPEISFTPKVMTEVAQVSSLSIRIDSPQIAGKVYRCIISPAELGALFGEGVNMSWNGQMNPFSSVTFNSTCLNLTCGDLKLAPGTQSFEGTTTVRVLGFIKDSSTRSERPIESVQTYQFHYSF